MALTSNKFQHMRSSVTTAVPTAAQMLAGQIAINTTDNKLFILNNSGVVTTIASAATVTSAASAVQAVNGLTGTSVTLAPTNIGTYGVVPYDSAGNIDATGAVNEIKVTLASASTVNIGAAAANYIGITGTTTITAFDTITAGARRTVEFSGILVLTYNATSLILPSGTNITTAAGDVAVFISEGSGNWRCADYTKANGTALVSTGGASGGSGSDIFYENAETVSISYAITTNKNAVSAGPIAVANGITVTIPTGSRWVIV